MPLARKPEGTPLIEDYKATKVALPSARSPGTGLSTEWLVAQLPYAVTPKRLHVMLIYSRA